MIATTHPLYHRWTEVKRRCTSPNHVSFHNYGGRGITVCKRWTGPRGFWNFAADMGPCPPGFWIERINNNRGYSPANCRWVHPRDQVANKRSHGWNKLTETDARAIRADPRRYYEIAADYSVTRPMVGYIKQGKCFAAVGGPLVTRPGRNTKLTREQVHAVIADPRRHWEIAADYGVHRSRVSSIKRNG